MSNIQSSRRWLVVILFCSLALLLASCGKDLDTQQSLDTQKTTEGKQYPAEPSIEVNPPKALVDEVVSIRLLGFAPEDRVTIRANMRCSASSFYESWATFVVDETGQVDLSTQQPLTGTYEIIDSMGLFWSMQKHRDIDIEFSPVGIAEPQIIDFSVEVDGNTVASTQVERVVMAPDVTRISVRENGLVGTLFLPAAEGPLPAVIVLGGSGGGLQESQAAILASHGYAAFALAYFGIENLPDSLIEIPLEYFENAIAWLQEQDKVNLDKLGVMGASRGGELALLLGATFSEIQAVVAYVPSGLVWEGLGTWGTGRSAWSYHGKPLSFMPLENTPEFQEYVNEQTAYARPVAYTPLFLSSIEDKSVLEEAAIPVENTTGPILLISGQDDQMWPSALFSEMIIERVERFEYSYAYLHLSYDGAGHTIGIPYRPTTVTQFYHPITGEHIAGGGKAVANAFANADSWPKVLDFLNVNLMNTNEQ